MGKLFDLIADKALAKLDDYYTECHVCDKAGIDLYHYDGKVHNANGETEDVYAVCAECIKTAALTHTAGFEHLRTIDHYLENIGESNEQLRNELVQKYQHTPNIPIFMQYEDRPLCCNAITEFTGHPHDKEELYKISDMYITGKKVLKKHQLYITSGNTLNPKATVILQLSIALHAEVTTLFFSFRKKFSNDNRSAQYVLIYG